MCRSPGGPPPWYAETVDVTGVGTLVLAAATLLLVVVTWRQTTYTRRAVQLSVRPLLADDEVRLDGLRELVTFGAPERQTVSLAVGALHYDDTDDTLQVSVSLRNVGTGAALISGARLDPEAGDVQVSQMLVPPGGRMRVNASAHLSDMNKELTTSIRESGHVAVIVSYTDASGVQPTQTRADIQVFATMGPVLESVSLQGPRHRLLARFSPLASREASG